MFDIKTNFPLSIFPFFGGTEKLGSFYCGKPGDLLRLGEGNFRG
jgi:hypothetical protein